MYFIVHLFANSKFDHNFKTGIFKHIIEKIGPAGCYMGMQKVTLSPVYIRLKIILKKHVCLNT